MVNWTVKNVDKKANVLDLGCGNGILLMSLVRPQLLVTNILNPM